MSEITETRKGLSEYQEKARCLVEDLKDLRQMQYGIDRISHLDYRLPEALARLEWVRPFISTAPYEAERAATRALATLLPRVKIEPISVYKTLKKDETPDSIAAKQTANAWEKVLLWQFGLTEGRQGVLLPDILRSALRYDEICGQIIYLPEQIRSVEAAGGNANRYKAMKRHGDFAVIMRNPKDVYVRYSDFMAEEVVFVQKYTPQGIVDFYGDRAEKIKAMIDRDDDNLPDNYIVFDYTDYEQHVVWCVAGDDVSQAVDKTDGKEKDIVELENRVTTHPLLEGWVCDRGGSSLETDPIYQRYPLMFPVYMADQWINTNLIGTLMMSEAVTKAAAPGATIEGPLGTEGIDIEAGTPLQPAAISPGHKYTQLVKEQLDPALREGYDRLEGAMNDATVARILTTADAVSGEAFASYNLRVNNAIGSLMPWKKLSERWVTDCMQKMLLWAHYTRNDLSGYGKEKKTSGTRYEIKGADVDPDSLYLTAELVADVPTDRLQKINAAIQMARELKVSSEVILDELGYSDPQGVMKDYYLEQFTFALVQGKLQLITAEASNTIEQLAAQRAQEMLQQAMQEAQAQQEAQAAQGGDGMTPEEGGTMGGAPPNLMGGNGMEAVGGNGFNPAMGGAPPAMADPMMNTREAQTGMTRAGVPI